MQINYFQGLLSGQRDDTTLAKIFLQLTNGFVNIYATATQLRAVASDGTKNYLIVEPFSVNSAWGPFPDFSKEYLLYWDVNTSTGNVTRGVTTNTIKYKQLAPINPILKDLWFNTSTNRMSEWTGSSWKKVVRVFAGKVKNGVLTMFNFESQTGLNTPASAGYILYNAGGTATRDDSTQTFVTTDKPIEIRFGSYTYPLSIETELIYAEAIEPIPSYSLVSVSDNNKIRLANGLTNKPAIGMIITDANIGESVRIYSVSQIIKNEQWNFQQTDLGKTLWLASDGNYTTIRPNGTKQIIGQILFKDSIILNVKPEVAYASNKIDTFVYSVSCTSTSNIDLSITHSTIDNYPILSGEYCLLKNQSDPLKNGIYKANTLGFLTIVTNNNEPIIPPLIYVRNGNKFQNYIFVIDNPTNVQINALMPKFYIPFVENNKTYDNGVIDQSGNLDIFSSDLFFVDSSSTPIIVLPNASESKNHRITIIWIDGNTPLIIKDINNNTVYEFSNLSESINITSNGTNYYII